MFLLLFQQRQSLKTYQREVWQTGRQATRRQIPRGDEKWGGMVWAELGQHLSAQHSAAYCTADTDGELCAQELL